MASAVKQLSISGWLTALGLQDYHHLFHRFTSIEELLMLCESDLKNLGVRNGSHRARMISSLVMLREKLVYQQRRSCGRSGTSGGGGGHSKTPGTSPISSTSSSPASLISHPDYASLPNPPSNLNYADFVPIQIPFQQQPQQTLGYIQIMPDVTDSPDSNQELYKYLWYHGNISRQKAESLAVNDGDFLLRDSISKPGEFVMTCAWRGAPLHFVVNKCMSTDAAGNVKVQYRFEEGLFTRISELIQYYIANKKLVSEMSGVRLITPVNRTATMHMEARGGGGTCRGPAMSATRSAGMSPRPSPFGSPSTTPSQSPVLGRRVVLPRRRGSQPLLDQDDDGGHLDGVHRKTSVPLCDGVHHHDTSPHRKHSAPLLDIHRSNTSPLLHTCAQESLSLSETHRETSTSSLTSSQQKTTSLTSLTSHGRAKFSICEVHEKACSSSSSISSAGNTPSAQTPPSSFRSQAISGSNSSLGSPAGRSGSPKQPAAEESREGSPMRPTAGPVSNVSMTEKVVRRTHTPPPKPSRTPTVKSIHKPRVQVRNKELYEDDGKDYTDYDQVKTWPQISAEQQREKNENEDSGEEEDYDNNFGQAAKIGEEEVDYDVPKASRTGENRASCEGEAYDVPPRTGDIRRVKNASLASLSASNSARSSSSSSGIEKDEDFSELPMKLPKFTVTLPDLEAPSMYNVMDFSATILPTENKPLQDTTMKTIKQMLLEKDPRLMAEHITQIDLQSLKVIGKHDLGVGVFSGLEHITLPQGSQLRQDLIERYKCMSRFVALTILICAKYLERASMLHKWIQIANELRGTLGNLYGFSAVMNGLRSPPLARVKNTWLSVKHNYSASSFLYESKLLAAINSMDEGSSSLPLQNVTVPHILPLIEILERDTTDITVIASWEDSKSDYGLDIILAHLDTARLITEQYGLYRVTSENILREFQPQQDILDTFSTELHLKLLWGARGAGVGPNERFSKFDQVLNVLSERAEAPNVIPADTANETSV